MTPAELKALDAAATPGPCPEAFLYWAFRHASKHDVDWYVDFDGDPMTDEEVSRAPKSYDAKLYAAARNALPALIRLWEASLLAREDAEQAAFLSGGVVHLTQNSLAFEAALRELREMKL